MAKIFHFPKKSTLAERLALCSKRDPATGCLMWTAGTKGGYGRIFWGCRYWTAHRIAWMLKFGQIPEGKNVCHKCDTPPCIEVEHLFVGTQPENIADMIAKGRDRKAHGEAHYKAKLTDKQIQAIRADTRTISEIAFAYGVSKSLVGMIRQRVIWKHL